MEQILENPHFWTSLALILLLLAIGKKLWTALTGMLDKRSQAIQNSIQEAQKLKNEAKELLEEYRKKQQESLNETSAILAQAKDLAANQTKEAKLSLEASLNRRTKAAMEKIALAEAAATKEVREEAVRLAIAAATEIIRNHLSQDLSAKLLDQTITDLQYQIKSIA